VQLTDGGGNHVVHAAAQSSEVLQLSWQVPGLPADVRHKVRAMQMQLGSASVITLQPCVCSQNYCILSRRGGLVCHSTSSTRAYALHSIQPSYGQHHAVRLLPHCTAYAIDPCALHCL
jgi:hypothetical protein